MFDFESLSLHHMITNPEFQECTMHGVVCVLVQTHKHRYIDWPDLQSKYTETPFPAGR